MKVFLFSLSLLLFGLPGFAAELKSAKARQMADQLIRSVNQKIRLITEYEMAEGVPPQNIKINLSQLESYNSGRFGALLDARTLGRVLSVTPESQADKLGLQSHDIILTVNGTAISDSDSQWRSQLQYTLDNPQVTLTISRGEQTLTLSGQLKAAYTPKWQLTSDLELLMPIRGDDNQLDGKGCGRVLMVGLDESRHHSGHSSYYLHLYDSTGIYAIDGIRKSAKQLRHKLSVGYHRLRFSAAGTNSKKRRKLPDKSINIEANTTYYLEYEKVPRNEQTSSEALYLNNQAGAIKAEVRMVISKTKYQECEL
ncbi:MAG: DNA-dependent RNA polymerase auxiliary subunit epsilon [Phenylobacterium sp.]|jgi:DNA-dependent RNA polymerase auxiliary subunit epsilon